MPSIDYQHSLLIRPTSSCLRQSRKAQCEAVCHFGCAAPTNGASMWQRQSQRTRKGRPTRESPSLLAPIPSLAACGFASACQKVRPCFCTNKLKTAPSAGFPKAIWKIPSSIARPLWLAVWHGCAEVRGKHLLRIWCPRKSRNGHDWPVFRNILKAFRLGGLYLSIKGRIDPK